MLQSNRVTLCRDDFVCEIIILLVFFMKEPSSFANEEKRSFSMIVSDEIEHKKYQNS